jgi:hypothetical protein
MVVQIDGRRINPQEEHRCTRWCDCVLHGFNITHLREIPREPK